MPQPGDLVFAHTAGLMGKAIRLGEWIRFRSGSYWNHVCCIDRMDLHGNVYVLQAEPHGVTNDKTLATLEVFAIVPLPAGADPVDFLRFGRKQLGSRYSWWTIVAYAFDILTPWWIPALSAASRRRPSWVCSTVTREQLTFAGWYHEWVAGITVPSQVYAAVTAET